MATSGMRWNDEKLKAVTDVKLARNMTKAVIFLESKIVQSFGSGGGAASDPGQPPNVQTGDLRRSVNHDVSIGPTVRGRVGTGIGNKDSIGYAMALEFGRKDGSIAARPFLRPALRRYKKVLNSIIAKGS